MFLTDNKIVFNNNGGIKIRIFITILTFIFLGVFIVFLLRKNESNQKFSNAEALRIAEIGLLTSLQPLQANPLNIKSVNKTDINNGWYSVKMSIDTLGDTLVLNVESIGGCNNITRVVKKTFFRNINDSSNIPWSLSSKK